MKKAYSNKIQDNLILRFFQFLDDKEVKLIDDSIFEWITYKFPEELDESIFPTLTIIRLQGRNLLEIPKFLLKCVNVTTLYLSDNYITDIENLENCTKLKRLYLCHNKIKEISGLDTLVDLNYLALMNNPITETTGLENLVSLSTIDLEGTKITRISNLGNDLKMLRKIFIDVEKLNKSSLERFKKLYPNVTIT